MPPKTPKKAPKPPIEPLARDPPVTDRKQQRILELQRVYMRVVSYAIFGGFLIGAVTVAAEGHLRPTTFSKPGFRRKAYEIGVNWVWLAAFVFGTVIGLVSMIDKWAIKRLAPLIENDSYEGEASSGKKDK